MSTTVSTELSDEPDCVAVTGVGDGADPPDVVAPGVEPGTVPVDPDAGPVPVPVAAPPAVDWPPVPPDVAGEPVVGVAMVIRLSEDTTVPAWQLTWAPPTACQVSPTTWMSSVG